MIVISNTCSFVFTFDNAELFRNLALALSNEIAFNVRMGFLKVFPFLNFFLNSNFKIFSFLVTLTFFKFMYPRRDSNPYGPYGPRDFKSLMATSFITGAAITFLYLSNILHRFRPLHHHDHLNGFANLESLTDGYLIVHKD